MVLMPTTESIVERDPLGRWQEAVSRALVPSHVTVRDGRPPGGRITAASLGAVRLCAVEGDAQRLTRTSAHIAHARGASEAFLVIGVLTSGTATLMQDGRHASVNEGDLMFYDTSRPYAVDHPGRFACSLVLLPRGALLLPDEQIRRVTGSAVTASRGVAAVLAPFLASLVSSAPACPPAVAAHLAAAVVDLATTLVADRTAHALPGPDTGRERLVRCIREHIDHHLPDPALSPQSVARAHHISVRYLHRLFEEEGVTVRRLIQRRRLEESARELARAGTTAPTVASVARRWGFVSPAHFSRAFRGLYGHSPREWRGLRTAHAGDAGRGARPAPGISVG
ncbi:transcriptional regulator [Streptomyces ambofaciens]|uniref:Transcriptional regulator n=2 Tax=Streptomyces ambofaciens TaxID=1889 RepID=A0ABN4P1N2_STRAM|nr:transcriptional regulator [Streptomyces ambofaciens]